MRSVLRISRRTLARRMSATVKSAQAIHSRPSSQRSSPDEPAAGLRDHLRTPVLVSTLAIAELVDQLDLHHRPLDGSERGEAPLDDPHPSLEIRRDQLARLLGEIEQDRAGFGNDEAVIVDGRRQTEAVDPPEIRAIEFAAGVIESVDAIGQSGFLERPLRPEVACFADHRPENASEAIECNGVQLSVQHGVILSRNLEDSAREQAFQQVPAPASSPGCA